MPVALRFASRRRRRRTKTKPAMLRITPVSTHAIAIPVKAPEDSPPGGTEFADGSGVFEGGLVIDARFVVVESLLVNIDGLAEAASSEDCAVWILELAVDVCLAMLSMTELKADEPGPSEAVMPEKPAVSVDILTLTLQVQIFSEGLKSLQG